MSGRVGLLGALPDTGVRLGCVKRAGGLQQAQARRRDHGDE